MNVHVRSVFTELVGYAKKTFVKAEIIMAVEIEVWECRMKITQRTYNQKRANSSLSPQEKQSFPYFIIQLFKKKGDTLNHIKSLQKEITGVFILEPTN